MVRSNILSTREKNKKRIKAYYAFIYVTERCNLSCEYCFFRHKQGRDMSLETVQRFFLLLEREETVPTTLIFSGGEAFLAKENLFKMVSQARLRFKNTSLHIQTNGSLIDKASIEKLRESGVSLGFGIDGGCEQTLRHRRGLKAASFKRLTETIHMCLKEGIPCGCTMTVHPHEVQYMAEGLNFLQGLGLSSVDVTPAAFMPWTPEAIALFKKNYLAAARQAHIRKVFNVRDDVQRIDPGCMDLSLHPPGYLLGGDPFLCLSEEKRKEFNLWSADNGKIRPEVLSFYKDFYSRLHEGKKRVLYREYVGQSFDLVNTMMGEEYMNAGAIKNISQFLTRTHRALRSRRSMS